MKVRVATIASVCSLLVVGSAAAMVNAVVLRAAAPAPTSAAPPVTPATSPAAATSVVPTNAVEVTGSTAVPATSTVDTTAAAVTSTAKPATTPTGTAAPRRTEGTFAAGNAGTVTISTTGGRLALVAVKPLSGWNVLSRSVAGGRVSITFRRGTYYVVFKANLLYGLVNYSVADYSVPTTTSHPPTTRPPVTNPPTTTTQPPVITPPPCVSGCDDD